MSVDLRILEIVHKQDKSPIPVKLGPDNYLEYTNDSLGNRIPDYSYCGYMAGEENIPDIPVKIIVPNQQGNATKTIQRAIDYVSTLSPDENGFRGTVLLEPGTYEVYGRLHIRTSGIVLRGSGPGKNGTRLIAAGTDRKTLITIKGTDDKKSESEIKIQDHYVPVNGTNLTLPKAHSLKAGDRVNIRRPVTQEWVEQLGMVSFGGETSWLGWKPDRNNLIWDRKVIAVDESSITLDVPLTTALDAQYGGGYISKYNWPGRITKVGIENIRLESAYDHNNPTDEDHCWMAITLENIENAWVRQVQFRHFAGSAVAVYETAKQVTIEDCSSFHPVSEIGGQRRYTFFTSGQQTLFQRCYAEYGYHDFAVGNFAPGPNAFVQCEAYQPHHFSGTIDRWASGVLYDLVKIDGQSLAFKNRMQENQGAGWTAANSLLWQCAAAKIECFSPPTATNWAFGTWGQFSGNGYWHESNSHIKPRSFYYAQLSDRLGHEVMNRAHILPMEFGSTSSPTVQEAKELTNKSKDAPVLLFEWIEQASQRNPIDADTKRAKHIDDIKWQKETQPESSQHPVTLKNGWLIANNAVITGQTKGVQWWRGTTRPHQVSQAGPHITRFVPGRYGEGLTDNLDDMTDRMVDQHILAIDHNYGLWYDRRRDDHQRVRRMDGEVWPPFYELPFARSGRGTAWDGLSQYDLTKPNIWYWSRLKEFADLADQKGLILLHQNYFQHNILEAGAHYADFPWRTANHVNNTGFPEPPPYAGDKRIFMDEQFYDISHPERRELHRQYIRQCLDNFAGNNNVIQLTSAEYTGPLHFVEFWIDVITEWENETGKNALVALSTTKDVQDSILADPVRSQAIEIIDIKYWHYRDDGTLYAPKGGQHLAPRQHARLVDQGKETPASIYRAVSEYKLKYPDKAVICSDENDVQKGWGIFTAGGSMAPIPLTADSAFMISAATMKPTKKDFTLTNEEGEKIIYLKQKNITLDYVDISEKFILHWIDPQSGKTVQQDNFIGGTNISLDAPQDVPLILWIKRKYD